MPLHTCPHPSSQQGVREGRQRRGTGPHAGAQTPLNPACLAPNAPRNPPLFRVSLGTESSPQTVAALKGRWRPGQPSCGNSGAATVHRHKRSQAAVGAKPRCGTDSGSAVSASLKPFPLWPTASLLSSPVTPVIGLIHCPAQAFLRPFSCICLLLPVPHLPLTTEMLHSLQGLSHMPLSLASFP